MIKKILFAMLLIPVLVFGQYERPGSTDAQFLKIGVSPRAAAMHSFRTNRWARTPRKESEMFSGFIPISSSRVSVSGALLVCSVDKTR